MCKLQEPTVQQLQQVRMSKPQSSQLIHTIFGSSDEESLTTPEQVKVQQLEKLLMEPQALIQGSNKRPKGKKTKKTVNPKEVIEDPPYAGDELRVIPPQPTLPTNLLMPGPSLAGNIEEYPRPSLPSYEEMMLDDMFNGPSSMETQPDLAPVKVLEEGVAVTQEDRTVEWWPVEEPEQLANMLEYLEDENKPLHTNFVLPNQGLALCYTCPVFFGSMQNKQIVAEALCNEIHSKILNQWGTLSCRCGLVPKLQLSQTPRNMNKVFLGCSKPREARCGYFQWIHEPPKPNYVPKTATRKALKKRLADMVSDRMSLEKKQKTEGRFKFP